MKILVTGGAGFIGSAVVRRIVRATRHQVVVVDKLTYAANLNSLTSVAGDPRYAFERADICDGAAMRRIFAAHRPDAVMHLAAKSHVDRSIDGPEAFIQTNVVGTYWLLEAARAYWLGLDAQRKAAFRFHHVSTDEVFGALSMDDPPFSEATGYDPRSPYSASKAASDHLVRAWWHTYDLPIVLTNCTNNYGPYHFPEKLIPLMIINALEGRPLPVYGRGENVRDWLHVDDHAAALLTVIERGEAGATYLVGGEAERSNLAVVETICDLVDELAGPLVAGRGRRELVTYVTDRPGHDFRYAMDIGKIARELDWRPRHTFEDGLRDTVGWFLANRTWWDPLRTRYQGQRLGTAAPAARVSA